MPGHYLHGSTLSKVSQEPFVPQSHPNRLTCLSADYLIRAGSAARFGVAAGAGVLFIAECLPPAKVKEQTWLRQLFGTVRFHAPKKKIFSTSDEPLSLSFSL